MRCKFQILLGSGIGDVGEAAAVGTAASVASFGSVN